MKLQIWPDTVRSTSWIQHWSEVLWMDTANKVVWLTTNPDWNTVPFGNIGNPYATVDTATEPDANSLNLEKTGTISPQSLQFPYWPWDIKFFPDNSGLRSGRRVNYHFNSLDGVQILETGVTYGDATYDHWFDDEFVAKWQLPAMRLVPTVLYIQWSEVSLWSVNAVGKFLEMNPQARLPTEEQIRQDMTENPNKYWFTWSVWTDITDPDTFQYTIRNEGTGSYLCKDGEQYKVIIFRPSDSMVTRSYDIPQNSNDFVTVHLLEN